MINLLSPQDKQELKREMIFRKLSAILSLHFICLLFLILAFGFLSAFFSSQTRSLQQMALQREQQLQSVQFQAFKKDIISLNDSLNKLQIFWRKQISVSDFLARFLPLISSDMRLESLSFRLSPKKTSTSQNASATSTNVQLLCADIRLDGVANSRDGLYEFKKLLERQNDFQDVYFAPSSWAKARYPDFSLSFVFSANNR